MKITKTVFSINDSDSRYVGYTYGEHWNGWACPMFPYEEAQRILAVLNEEVPGAMSYDIDKDCFICRMDDNDEPDIYEVHDVETIDGTLQLYDIGNRCWIWDDLLEDQTRLLNRTATRKEFEERLLTELLADVYPEQLCNLLMYASEYLRGKGARHVRPVDIERAALIDRCQNEMATRIREVRE